MSIQDFMFSMIEKPVTDINQKLYEKQREYEKRFGHGVPREMLPDSLTDEQLFNAIGKGIEAGNDNIFSILGIKENEDYIY